MWKAKNAQLSLQLKGFPPDCQRTDKNIQHQLKQFFVIFSFVLLGDRNIVFKTTNFYDLTSSSITAGPRGHLTRAQPEMCLPVLGGFRWSGVFGRIRFAWKHGDRRDRNTSRPNSWRVRTGSMVKCLRMQRPPAPLSSLPSPRSPALSTCLHSQGPDS